MTTLPVNAPRGGHPGARGAGSRPGRAAAGSGGPGVERAGVSDPPAALPRTSTLPRQRVNAGAVLMVLAAFTGVVGMLAHAFGDAAAGIVWAVMR